MIRLFPSRGGVRNERRPLLNLILAATAMAACSHSLDAQWTRIPSPQFNGAFLYDIEFATPSTGHAIAQIGSATRMYRTTDGGATWKTMTGFGLVPASFSFLDENTGVAGGRSAGCECMAVSRTTDGGVTWTLDTIRSAAGDVEKIPGYGVNAISFADDMVGYGVGIYGTMLKTTDGGAGWARQPIGNTTDFVSDISAPTTDHVYAIAAPSIRDASYILYRSADGGGSWLRTPDFIDSAGFQEISFITPEVGFVGGYTAEQAIIYKTADGGATWSRKYAGGAAGSAIFGIEFQDHTTGYAVGSNGLILRTTDGGESWTQEPSGTTRLLVNLSIVNGTVFVAGEGGTVLRRTEGSSGVDPVSPREESMKLDLSFSEDAVSRTARCSETGGAGAISLASVAIIHAYTQGDKE